MLIEKALSSIKQSPCEYTDKRSTVPNGKTAIRAHAGDRHASNGIALAIAVVLDSWRVDGIRGPFDLFCGRRYGAAIAVIRALWPNNL